MKIEEDIRGYRFEDLKAAGILKSRTDLARKQETSGFPLPVKLGKRQAWFPAREVQAWLAQRISERPRRQDLSATATGKAVL